MKVWSATSCDPKWPRTGQWLKTRTFRTEPFYDDQGNIQGYDMYIDNDRWIGSQRTLEHCEFRKWTVQHGKENYKYD